LGLARNEENHRRWFGRKWWVTAGSAVVGECRHWRGEGELEKKKKKEEEEEEEETRCVREVREKKGKKKKNQVFCFHFIFFEMVRCQYVNGG
jgi:hypothetical protein